MFNICFVGNFVSYRNSVCLLCSHGGFQWWQCVSIKHDPYFIVTEWLLFYYVYEWSSKFGTCFYFLFLMLTPLTMAIPSSITTFLILLSVPLSTLSILWLHSSCCNLNNFCAMLALSVLKQRHPSVAKSDVGTTKKLVRTKICW